MTTSRCKRKRKCASAEKRDTIESSMGVVLDADGDPSCFVKGSDGIIWVNNLGVGWSMAQAAEEA